jgi:two-component system OmpR family sensor kinase
VLRVTTGGPPVPPETLGRLFRRFERGQTAADGSGLGLAIADIIARGVGARLVLHSPAPGRTDGFEAILSPGGLVHGYTELSQGKFNNNKHLA